MFESYRMMTSSANWTTALATLPRMSHRLVPGMKPFFRIVRLMRRCAMKMDTMFDAMSTYCTTAGRAAG